MTINFECGYCGKKLSTPDDKAGKTGRCPDCGEPVTVPQPQTVLAAEDPFTYEIEKPPPVTRRTAPRGPTRPCPMCGAQVAARDRACPSCGEDLRPAGGRPGPEHRFSAGNRIDAGQVLSTAWQRFLEQPGAAIGGLVISALLMMGIGIAGLAGFAIAGLMIRVSLALMLLTLLAVAAGLGIAGACSTLGLTSFFIGLARGRTADFSLLFSAGRFVLRAVLCGLLLGMINLAVMIGVGAMVLAAEAIAGGTGRFVAAVAALVILVYVSMSFLWCVHILVDTDARDISSVFMSRELMAGNYLNVLLILFANGVIAMLPFGLLATVFLGSRVLIELSLILIVVISLFFVAPLSQVLMGVTYDHLSGGGGQPE